MRSAGFGTRANTRSGSPTGPRPASDSAPSGPPPRPTGTTRGRTTGSSSRPATPAPARPRSAAFAPGSRGTRPAGRTPGNRSRTRRSRFFLGQPSRVGVGHELQHPVADGELGVAEQLGVRDGAEQFGHLPDDVLRLVAEVRGELAGVRGLVRRQGLGHGPILGAGFGRTHPERLLYTKVPPTIELLTRAKALDQFGVDNSSANYSQHCPVR